MSRFTMEQTTRGQYSRKEHIEISNILKSGFTTDWWRLLGLWQLTLLYFPFN